MYTQGLLLCMYMYVWSSGLLHGSVIISYVIRIPVVLDAFFFLISIFNFRGLAV